MQVRFNTLLSYVPSALAYVPSVLALVGILTISGPLFAKKGHDDAGHDHANHGHANHDHAGQKNRDHSSAWVSLFNGKDLSGWKASESKGTFKVVNGNMVAKGRRSHLFYVGKVQDAQFKNFEWKCEILTKPNSNSGMYFHTEYQKEGWPNKGYEVQVNNSHEDPKKTGGLYGIADVMDKSPVKDGKWFTQHVIVNGKKIIVKVNGKVTAEYTEPENPKRPKGMKGRLLSRGTIALQGHDPGSEVHFRKIMIRPLP